MPLDTRRKQFVHHGLECPLTPNQYGLIEYLAAHPGHLRSRADIMDRLCLSLDTDERTIDGLIKRTRNRLGRTWGRNARSWIETRYGWGYAWRGPV